MSETTQKAEQRETQETSVLLLKTKSIPHDGYEEYFSKTYDDIKFTPQFVPVLEHRFISSALDDIQTLISARGLNGSEKAKYGGMIFTSQRAVEAFSSIVTSLRNSSDVAVDILLPASLPLYVVGPATARGLRALELLCPILGEETGNGEALAHFMLEDYNGRRRSQAQTKLPLLFLVGEQRRDIIPKTLQSASDSIDVNEVVIYETGEMASFKKDISHQIKQNEEKGYKRQWVVVFSPTGCKAMLEVLDFMQGNGKPRQDKQGIFVATIGPTTRDYLEKEFGFRVDVCAVKPSPEGVGDTMRKWMMSQKAFWEGLDMFGKVDPGGPW